MLITIAIPTYEMFPHGSRFLDFSLNKLAGQSYKNFEVVISDHSKENDIEKVAEKWAEKLKITYIRKTYKTDNPSSNLNNIINNSKGEFIKILFQDDFLFDEFSLQKTVDKIKESNLPAWMVSSCQHSEDGNNMIKSFYPEYNRRIHLGFNTISSPSVLTIKNDPSKIYFNENFKWLMDCVYYKDCFMKFGKPVIIEDITIVNRLWGNQLTNQLSNFVKEIEVLEASKIYDSFIVYSINRLKAYATRYLKKTFKI